MVARDFNFYPLEGKDALDMKQKVADLKHEELRLVRKTGNTAMMNTSSTESTEIVPSTFLFTRETAGTYCEYKVIKTNDRGKRQERIIVCVIPISFYCHCHQLSYSICTPWVMGHGHECVCICHHIIGY
jgi:hypothetical protein